MNLGALKALSPFLHAGPEALHRAAMYQITQL